jgi:hypothetical protein
VVFGRDDSHEGWYVYVRKSLSKPTTLR